MNSTAIATNIRSEDVCSLSKNMMYINLALGCGGVNIIVVHEGKLIYDGPRAVPLDLKGCRDHYKDGKR